MHSSPDGGIRRTAAATAYRSRVSARPLRSRPEPTWSFWRTGITKQRRATLTTQKSCLKLLLKLYQTREEIIDDKFGKNCILIPIWWKQDLSGVFEPGGAVLSVRVFCLPPGIRAIARVITLSEQMKIHQHNLFPFPNTARLEVTLNFLSRIKVSSLIINMIFIVSNHTFTTHLQQCLWLYVLWQTNYCI